MNFKPILFSTDMVRAILENRKTQTRRTTGLEDFAEICDESYWTLEGVSDDPALIIGSYANGDLKTRVAKGCHAHFHWSGPGDIWKAVKCPYGCVGDVLWVRETWCKESVDEKEWFYVHKAGNENYPMGSSSWKPSIHMPKSACRLFLEITDIWVERLHDIDDYDYEKEGFRPHPQGAKSMTTARIDHDHYMKSAQPWWENLWTSINGPESWEANPFVWVVSFHRIDKPEGFA